MQEQTTDGQRRGAREFDGKTLRDWLNKSDNEAVVVGRLPAKGQTVVINGLEYEVVRAKADDKRVEVLLRAK